MTIKSLAIITSSLPKVEKKTNKKKGFNILVTDEGKQKYYLKNLERELKKYPFLKQQNFFRRNVSLSSASYLDAIVFGSNNNFDYLVTNKPNNVPIDFKIYDLVSDFSKIVEKIKTYAEANYPSKFNTKKNFDIEINIEIVSAPPKKRKEKLEVYRIHDTFVKIGYKSYDIYVDTLTGDEYIKIKGEKIFILEDKSGNKYLA